MHIVKNLLLNCPFTLVFPSFGGKERIEKEKAALSGSSI